MTLMDGHRSEDLQRMYTLFSRVNALESFRQALNSYIRRTGQSIVMDDEKDKDMVSSLLEFKASLDTIWEESFSKNEAFSNTIKDAFEHLINLRQVWCDFLSCFWLSFCIGCTIRSSYFFFGWMLRLSLHQEILCTIRKILLSFLAKAWLRNLEIILHLLNEGNK